MKTTAITAIALAYRYVSTANAMTTIGVCPKAHQDLDWGAVEPDYHTHSLEEARDLARRLNRTRNGGNNGGVAVTIDLCPGRHFLSNGPLVLTTADSGVRYTSSSVSSAASSLRAVNDYSVPPSAVLDGGYPVTGWQVVNDTLGLWRASVTVGLQSRQLWVNGARAVRARTSPASPSPIFSNGIITESGYTVDDQHVTDWLVGGAEFVYRPKGASWTEPRCGVAGVTQLTNGSTAIAVAQPCFSVGRGKGSQSLDWPAYVENARALLDTPGEWFLDSAAGTVYYIHLPGENITQVAATLGTVATNPSTASATSLTATAEDAASHVAAAAAAAGAIQVCVIEVVRLMSVAKSRRLFIVPATDE